MSRPDTGKLSAGGKRSAAGGDLVPCHTCGRTFLPDVLTRHVGICAKTFNRKRRVFESGRQRISGTGISVTKIVKPGQVKNQGVKQTNWRRNHKDFVNAIRSARKAQHAIRTGKPLPPPPPPSVNPDYIQCPHCSRRFNQTAAARHINFCGERTNTYGSPVKPLNKRAAADIKGSRMAIRKAYDNIIVRRKPATNPYAYAQGNTEGEDNVMVYSAAFGGLGPDQQASTVTARKKYTSPRRRITSPRQYLSPHQQQASPHQQQASPIQRTSPRQQISPRFQPAITRDATSFSYNHQPSSSRFQSGFQQESSLLPQATSRQKSPNVAHLPPATGSHHQLPWQQPPFSQGSSPQQDSSKQQSSPFTSSGSAFPHQIDTTSSHKSPPPLQSTFNSLPPWQQGLASANGASPRTTRLPNGHIRRSRLIKSGKPKGSVRFSENVEVQTFGDTFPGPMESSGFPDDASAPYQSDFAHDNALPHTLNEDRISQHQDLMSVLKGNYGDEVMLATPGNHMEEMMLSRRLSQLSPHHKGPGGMGGYGGNQGGHATDLVPQSMGLQRGALHSLDKTGGSSVLPATSPRTSYQDSFSRNDFQSFESTTPLDFGNSAALHSNYNQPSQVGPPTGSGMVGSLGRRPRPIGSTLRGPLATKPSPSDFGKLSISGSTQRGGGLHNIPRSSGYPM
ncbi:uncharacterized protein [Diadema antillarum]|uniref:uncharacterized protein n=1 Tax=Diadema antillarum TaxID=105358 RepID=UPI003A875BB4